MAKSSTPKSALARTIGAAVHRLDSWKNFFTGLGTSRDKRLSTLISAPVVLTWNDLEDLYQGNDLAARIIEKKPDEMCREGFELQLPGDKELQTKIAGQLDELDIVGLFHRALCWARAYGGAAIVMGADDGQDPRMPLDLQRLKEIRWMRVHAADELTPVSWYTDPGAPRFGEPRTFRLSPVASAVPASGVMMAEIHESRLIRFNGVVVSNRQLSSGRTWGWGDSVLTRVHDVLRDYDANWDNAAVLMADFSQGVWKLDGLTDLIAGNKAGIVEARVQAAEMSRSTLRSLLIDKEDDFQRQTTPMGGMSDMMQRFDYRLAAAAEMPVTLLMGQSPAGLNATGDTDVRYWYMGVAAGQRKTLRPALNRFAKVFFAAKKGPTKGQEPESWKWHFPDLWQLSSLERAELRKTTAEADDLDIKNGVLTPEEVATSRYGGEEYSTQTTIDLEARAELAAEDPAPEEPPAPGAPGATPALPPGAPTSPPGPPQAAPAAPPKPAREP